MAKNKKKGAKKGINSDDLLDLAAVSIKRFRRVTKQIGKLSTGQKVAGGLALLATGLVYLAKQPNAVATVEADGGSGSAPPEEAATNLMAAKVPARRKKNAGV